MTPMQQLEREQRAFSEKFMRMKREGFKSNHAIIVELLADPHTKDYANIGTYQGARKVLDKYAPEWKNKL